MEGVEHELRLTALGSEFAAILAGPRLGDVRYIDIGGFRFEVLSVCRSAAEHPLVGCSTYGELWTEWIEADAVPGHVTLAFLSPTAFATDSNRELFPTPSILTGTLGRKWNRHAPTPIPEDLLKSAAASARIDRYDLRTEVARFGGFYQRGFVGRCAFSTFPDAPEEARRIFRLLCAFAFFSGVGLRTTMGMGQTIPHFR